MNEANAPDRPPLERRIHPASGRPQAQAVRTVRQLGQAAHDEVRDLLGGRPRDRDLLIEHLHLIQDRYGCLSAAHLHALAEEMKLPMAEVYEVASFYAHFDIVLDGEAAPAEITIRVCDSLTCEMMVAEALLAGLPARLGAKVGAKFRVLRAPCLGRCATAPVAGVGPAPCRPAPARRAPPTPHRALCCPW